MSGCQTGTSMGSIIKINMIKGKEIGPTNTGRRNTKFGNIAII
jgi:hypothetical protein